MTHALALIAALLFVYPHTPARNAINSQRGVIANAMDAALGQHPSVPASMLIAVGFVETHLGTDRASGGGWGAPISPLRRHVAGGAEHAARALARSLRVCGNWSGALARFRTGLCRGGARSAIGQNYARRVLALARRLERETQRSAR